MSEHTDSLRDKWEKAEAKAVEVQASKDDAVAKVRERYADKQRKANDAAASAQKEYNDAVAAEALLDRPDGAEIAERLGLTLPD
jgi:hypothetical protein